MFHCVFVSGVLQQYSAAALMFMNKQMLHSRTAFTDSTIDKRKQRHLLRLWVSAQNGRKLPPVFKERYTTVEVGPPRGIAVCFVLHHLQHFHFEYCDSFTQQRLGRVELARHSFKQRQLPSCVAMSTVMTAAFNSLSLSDIEI